MEPNRVTELGVLSLYHKRNKYLRDRIQGNTVIRGTINFPISQSCFQTTAVKATGSKSFSVEAGHVTPERHPALAACRMWLGRPKLSTVTVGHFVTLALVVRT